MDSIVTAVISVCIKKEKNLITKIGEFLYSYFNIEDERKTAMFHHIGLATEFFGLPGGTSGQEHTCQSRRLQGAQVQSLVGEIPLRRAW